MSSLSAALHSIVQIAGWQFFAYSIFTWAAFVAIAFCGSRFLGWAGMFVGQIVVAGIIFVQDVEWIRSAMSAPGWDGEPDMDILFDIGVVLRIVLINSVLLSVTALGFHFRKKKAGKLAPPKSVGILIHEDSSGIVMNEPEQTEQATTGDSQIRNPKK